MNPQLSATQASVQAAAPAQEVAHAPVSRAIYGLITVLAVLQVMEVHPPSAWHGTVSLFGTTLAVALADAYSDSIAEMLSGGHRLSREHLRAIGHDVWPVLAGAQGPTLVLLASALGEDGVRLLAMPVVAPADYWAVCNDLRERIKERFDAEGIQFAASRHEVRLTPAIQPDHASQQVSHSS